MKEREEIDFYVRSIIGLSRQLPPDKQPEMVRKYLRWLEKGGIARSRLADIEQRVKEGLLGHCLDPADTGKVLSVESSSF